MIHPAQALCLNTPNISTSDMPKDHIAPISKRKSCGECVKAKRKCGMELPKCKRCQKKNMACVYPNKMLFPEHALVPDLEFSWLDGLLSDPSVLPWTGDLQPQIDSTFTVRQKIPDFLIATEGSTRSALARAETDAALHHFKTWPDKWLKEGKAPFIHPRLYVSGMPKSLQDAYAACAIYSTKTINNSFIAFTGKFTGLGVGHKFCFIFVPICSPFRSPCGNLMMILCPIYTTVLSK